jgi:hypothetical protein
MNREFTGGSSGNVANGSAAASIAAAAGYRGYITGFDITGAGATAAANVVATLTGLLGGTRSYVVSAPAGATAPITPLAVRFDEPLPASGLATAITVTLPALGAGNTHACVNVHGFREQEA